MGAGGVPADLRTPFAAAAAAPGPRPDSLKASGPTLRLPEGSAKKGGAFCHPTLLEKRLRPLPNYRAIQAQEEGLELSTKAKRPWNIRPPALLAAVWLSPQG